MLRQEDWEFQTKLTTQRELAPSFIRLTSISQNALDFFSSRAHTAHYVVEDEAAYTLFLRPALYVLWILSVKPLGSLQHKAANGSPGSVSWGRTFFTSLRTNVRVGRKVLKDSMEEQVEWARFWAGDDIVKSFLWQSPLSPWKI